MPTPTDSDALRDARRAATLAARTERVTYGPQQDVPVSDVRPGDFLVVVPTQGRHRGVRYETVVTEVRTVARGERLQGAYGPIVSPVAGVVFATGRGGQVDWGSVVHTATYRATVRRPTNS